jgi:hypothetical protein
MGAISRTDADTSKVKTNNTACMFFFFFCFHIRDRPETYETEENKDVPQSQKAEETSYIASIMQIDMKE